MHSGLHRAGKDCLRAVQRGDYGSGTKPDPCLSAHLHRWHSAPFGKCATVRRKGTSQCWDKCEICFTVLLAALEQLQSCRSLAQALQTAQIPERGAGSCHTSPWHWDPLLQPCSISHCCCGGQKADLGQQNSTSANKVL